jgi:autotransporter-associated beta strand protein
VRYSDNDGATWSAPVQVNDDVTTRSQFMPAIALDQTTGYVAVTWYDARNSASNTAVQVFGSVSTDGGATFATNVQISAGATDATAPTAGSFNLGDFDKMDFSHGVFYRTWADNSNSTGDNPNGTLNALNIYTAKVTVAKPLATPAFTNLSSPTIIYGTATTTFSGRIAAGSAFPTGDEVLITLNGVTQSSLVDSSGNFSSSFATNNLPVPGCRITYSFSGDGTKFSAAADGYGTLTVMPQVLTFNSVQTIVSLEASSNTQYVIGAGGDVTVSSVANLASGGAVNVGSGGRVTLPGINSQSGATGIGLDSGTLRASASFTSTAPIIIGAGGATIDCNGHNVQFAHGLSGQGGLTITGAGILTLTGTNSYGGTTLSSGKLIIAISTSLADGSSLTVGANANGFFGSPVAAPMATAAAAKLGVSNSAGASSGTTLYAGHALPSPTAPSRTTDASAPGPGTPPPVAIARATIVSDKSDPDTRAHAALLQHVRRKAVDAVIAQHYSSDPDRFADGARFSRWVDQSQKNGPLLQAWDALLAEYGVRHG